MKRPACLHLLALAVVNGPAAAQEPKIEGSVSEGSVSIGAAVLSGNPADRARLGQYNGWRTPSAVVRLDASVETLDPLAGSSARLEVTNLLGATREVELRVRPRPDWKIIGHYSEGVRDDPSRPSTGADLRITRTRLGLSLVKVLDEHRQLALSLSSEDKTGARMFGIGMNCPSSVAPGCGVTTGTEVGWAVLMRPELLQSNHSRIEARFSHAGESLRVSAGYAGSFYSNSQAALAPDVPATLNNALGAPLPLSAGLQAVLNQPVALAPDNQAHQIDVTGLLRVAPGTQLTFKLMHAQALQHQDFAAAGLGAAPAGVSHLGGRVDTWLGLLGLTARPAPKLALQGRLRYEDRNDRTPLAPYNVEDTATYTNRHLSGYRLLGQAQASYQFSADGRGSLGVDHEAIGRGSFTPTSAVAGITALRQTTDETGAHAEWRQRLDETFGATLTVARHLRRGSNWLRDNSGLGVTEVTDPTAAGSGLGQGVFMPTLADRRRDTVRLLADWAPAEAVSLQLSAQTGRDHYSTPSAYGVRDAGTDLTSVEAGYVLSERWSLTGHLTYGAELLRQARPAVGLLSFDNTSRAMGLGVQGKLNSKLDLGAGVSFIDDRSVFAQRLDALADGSSTALLAATGGLPDIVFRQVECKLTGRYAMDKQSEWRLDLLHQRSTWTDWAWGYNGVPFTYSDGTTLQQQARQQASVLSLRYVHRWQ